MTSLISINVDNAAELLNEIRETYFDVPFTNTAFQTEMFVIANAITPARAWRSIGMSMQSLIFSIQNLLLEEEKTKIDIEELEFELNQNEINQFEKRRKQIKLKEICSMEPERKKRLNDLICELNLFYKYFKAMPKLTRQEFEDQERLYFEQSLQRQILGITGAKEALINMTEDIKTIENFQSLCLSLNEEQKNLLQTAIASLASPVNIQFQQDIKQ